MRLNEAQVKLLAYSSVPTMLSIMLNKGLLARGADAKRPIHTKEEVEDKLIKRLKRAVFGGSTTRLVSRALATDAPCKADLAKIQDPLGALESKPEDSDVRGAAHFTKRGTVGEGAYSFTLAGRGGGVWSRSASAIL